MSKLSKLNIGEDIIGSMSITLLVDYLIKKIGWHGMVNWIQDKQYIVTPINELKNTYFKHNVIIINYLKYNNLWKQKWAQNCRGTVIANIDGKTRCLKSLLDRGIDIYTKIHKDHKYEEQYKVSRKIEYLTNSQKDVINAFELKTYLNGIISMKKDGYLLGISLYPKGTIEYDFMKTLIITSDNTFSKVLMNNKIDMPFMPVISGQNTLFLEESMYSYIVTAYVCGMCSVNFEEFKDMVDKKNLTPIKVFKNYISILRRVLHNFWNNCTQTQQKQIMCLSFESICPKRMDAWNYKYSELTVSYPTASMDFIGCTFEVGITTGYYKTHSQLESYIINTGMTQPLYWIITITSQIEDLIKSLHKVIIGKITPDDYLELHPPSNHLKKKKIHFLDYEGFVLFTQINDNEFKLNYFKIKTPEYYLAHKFNANNLERILNLNTYCYEIFPLLKSVHSFYNGICQQLMNIFNKLDKDMDSILSNETKIDFDEKKVTRNTTLIRTMKKNTLGVLWNKPIHVRKQMIIATTSGWSNLVFERCKVHFPQLQNDKITLKLMKMLSMRFSIKSEGRKELINNILANKNIKSKDSCMFTDLFIKLNI